MRSPRRGFTVLELLIVMIIAGIVAGIGMTRMSQYMMKERLSKAALSITNDVQEAFAVAGRNRRPIRLLVDTTKMQIVVTDRPQTTVFRRNTLSTDFNLTASNVSFYPSTPLEIYPNGLASDSMWIRFRYVSRNDSTIRWVRVSRAGMIRVSSQ